MKRLVYILGILLLLSACDETNSYKIDGKLSNLDDATLFVVFESPEQVLIDTISCNEKGSFNVFREQFDDLQTITFYYNDRDQWFTVYPEAGKPVQVTGDARYPKLLQIKGGHINNKLSQFKKKASPILKELADLQMDNHKNRTFAGEETMHIPNLNVKLRNAVQDFISKNPSEEASAVLISDFFANPDEIEQTEDLLQLLSPALDDYFLVKNIRKEVEKAKTTQEGAKAPDFKVTNIYGQSFTVDSFANKYLILAFTALWCEMCQTEVMLLDGIASKYSKDSLEILLISLDDELEDIREMIRQDTIQWNLVADSAGQAIQLFDVYNVYSLPKCFLMDKNGIILLNTTNGEELKQTVDEIMKSTEN